ncbi:hypothetical protein ACH4VS_10910 [Streptomyces hygroscopicus]
MARVTEFTPGRAPAAFTQWAPSVGTPMGSRRGRGRPRAVGNR